MNCIMHSGEERRGFRPIRQKGERGDGTAEYNANILTGASLEFQMNLFFVLRVLTLHFKFGLLTERE